MEKGVTRDEPSDDATLSEANRNWVVAYARPLPDDDPLRPFELPQRFPFVVDECSGEIDEPSFLFIVDTYLSRSGVWNFNTARDAAMCAVDWRRFLSFEGIAWDLVDQTLLNRYRDSMLNQISFATHEEFSAATINRRRRFVMRLYDWAAKKGVYHGELHVPPASRSYPGRGDGQRGKSRDPGAVPPRPRKQPSVRPMFGDKYSIIAPHLGVLPNDRVPGDPTSSSCHRLASDLAVTTGLREDEVCNLDIYQILELPPPSPQNLEGGTRLWVCKTKGLNPRYINIPNDLLPDLFSYIQGERNECLAEARKYWLKTKNKIPSQLFLNPLWARQDAGKPLRPNTLYKAFTRAVIDAGYTSTVVKTHPDTGETYRKVVAQHSMHDTRHTFAVWVYLALVAQGRSEPWKEVQALLGHRYVSTTRDTYLAVVSSETSRLNDAVWQRMKDLRNAQRT